MQQWHHAFLEARRPNGQLIINVTAGIVFVIGKQKSFVDLEPQEARNRFNLVFQRYLGASRNHGCLPESAPTLEHQYYSIMDASRSG